MKEFVYCAFNGNGVFQKEIHINALTKEDADCMIKDDSICPYPVALFGTSDDIFKS